MSKWATEAEVERKVQEAWGLGFQAGWDEGYEAGQFDGWAGE